MNKNIKYSIFVVAAATLIATSSVQASPIYYDDQSAFDSATSGENLFVEDFETLKSNTASGTDFGAYSIETGDDIDKASNGTNGPVSLKISKNTDGFIKFTFDAPITAFGIDLVDALDTGGGDIYVTVDGGSPQHFLGPTGDLDNLNKIFIGIVDLDGFSMVRIDSTDNNDLLFYDNLRHTRITEPTTIAVFGMGLAGLGIIRRRRSTSL